MGAFSDLKGKRVTDVQEFIRNAARNEVKYTSESGATHMFYLPEMEVNALDANGNPVVHKSLYALEGEVHEWKTADGKYGGACVCLKDVVRKASDGVTLLNDGSCPFCEHVSDAYDIVNYRFDIVKARCNLVGEKREEFLKDEYSDIKRDIKIKKASPTMYALVAQFVTKNDSLVMNKDGLPDWKLKIMKLSSYRIETINTQMEKSGGSLPGSEITIVYPAIDDVMLRVTKSTITPVFPNYWVTNKYPGVREAIQKAAAEFSFADIEKSFREWEGMTVAEAQKIVSDTLNKWNQYKLSAATNPRAVYMEYVTDTRASTPEIGVGAVQSNIPIADVNSAFQGGDVPQLPFGGAQQPNMQGAPVSNGQIPMVSMEQQAQVQQQAPMQQQATVMPPVPPAPTAPPAPPAPPVPPAPSGIPTPPGGYTV